MKQHLGLAMIIALAACSQSNVFDLSVGACFDDDLSFSEEVSDLPLVECSEPHDNEIYAIHTMTDLTDPGFEITGELADEWCIGEFEGFVGVAYEVSELAIGWLAPTEDPGRVVIVKSSVISSARSGETIRDHGRLRGVNTGQLLSSMPSNFTCRCGN